MRNYLNILLWNSNNKIIIIIVTIIIVLDNWFVCHFPSSVFHQYNAICVPRCQFIFSCVVGIVVLENDRFGVHDTMMQKDSFA